jgi:hypothetical protein
MSGLVHLIKDPIMLCIVLVMGVVYWKAWGYVSDHTSTEEGSEFHAAGLLFVIFLVVAAISVGLRVGIKKATGL